MQQIADLPVLPPYDRVEVTGRVSGVATPMLIDTGSERTVLTTGTVASLMLPRSQRSATALTGIAGTVSNADVYAVLELGNARFEQRLAVADIAGFGALVGGDLLSDYDVEFDLPDGHVRLWRARGCSAGDLPWSGPRTTTPIDVTGGDRVRVPVTIDGTTVDALLDSGASLSVMQTDVARRVGVTSAALAGNPELTVRGIDGGTIVLHLHRFASLHVGDDPVGTLRIGVGDSQIGLDEMLLGVDYLRDRRVWISYGTERLFIQKALP